MIASELYSICLSDLVRSRDAMLDPVWIEALQTQSAETRLQASMALVQVQQGIAALANAALSDIADRIVAEEKGIRAATANLGRTLEDLTHVQAALNAITSLVGLVASVVRLV